MKELSTENQVRIINPKKLGEEGITGTVLTGTFKEERVEELKQNNTGKKFTSRSFIFVDDEGKDVIVNATGHLSYLMEAQEVKPGDRLSVQYLGRDGEARHQFKLIAA